MPSIPFRSLALAAILGGAAPEMAVAQQAHSTAAFTDTELQSYAKARAEIEPIQLAELTADASQRVRDEAQINAALARNAITREDYDAIATVAMADTGMSARISRLSEATGARQGA